MAEVVVIRTREPDKLREFLEGSFGLKFVKENHKPFHEDHWVCVSNGKVFEIYPTNSEGPNGVPLEQVIFL